MGNMLKHGVAMYKKTINLKDVPAPPPLPIPSARQPSATLPPKKPAAAKPSSAKQPSARQAPAQLHKTVTKQDTHLPPVIESKTRRVAKFLILIGSEQASEILAELDPDQVEAISKEIAFIKTIKPDEKEEILAEFRSLFSSPSFLFSGSSRGGIETARRILYAAKGPEKGEEILNNAIPTSKENLFSFLEEFSPEQLIMLLKSESAQTTAIILSRLPPKLSADTISKLPAGRKPDVLKRMAYQREISPDVLEQITEALREKVRHISGGAKDIEIDGMQTLAAILKQGDFSFGDKIINELEETSPEISKEIKNKIYTLDDVIHTVERPIQEKLASMSDTEIAILMKGRGKEFCEKLLTCVSVGRRKIIREEFDVIGAVPKRDCDAAASEFLAWFRLAREKGDIVLYSDKDVFL